MRAQIQAEMELAHAWRPMPPPKPGHYLVSCLTRDADRKVDMRYTRQCYFDGTGWPHRGGYVVYEGWKPVPEPLGPRNREAQSPKRDADPRRNQGLVTGK